MSILAQYGNNRHSFNQSLLFEKKNYSFISWSSINNKQLNMVTFPPRPVDIHGGYRSVYLFSDGAPLFLLALFRRELLNDKVC